MFSVLLVLFHLSRWVYSLNSFLGQEIMEKNVNVETSYCWIDQVVHVAWCYRNFMTSFYVYISFILKYRIWKRERDLQNVAWKIHFKDIDFLVGKQVRSFMVCKQTIRRFICSFTKKKQHQGLSVSDRTLCWKNLLSSRRIPAKRIDGIRFHVRLVYPIVCLGLDRNSP